jgi:purine-binding chemotaxis protein CheW
MDTLLQENTELDISTEEGRFLTFSLGKEVYGIEIKYVTEIVGLQGITEIPELPSYVKGIINLRGKIIPVIDVRLRFKKDAQEYNDRTCNIVVNINNCPVGLIVDMVTEVITISQSDIIPPPQINNECYNRYIKGVAKVEGTIKLLVDCEKLLSSEEVSNISKLI